MIEAIQRQMAGLKNLARSSPDTNQVVTGSEDLGLGDVEQNIQLILQRIQSLEKNDTYQDQHLADHKKKIDELQKLMKNFTNKLNQLQAKGGSGEPVEAMPMPSFDNDLGEKLEERIEMLEEGVKDLKEKKVDQEKYDLESYLATTRIEKLEELMKNMKQQSTSPSRISKMTL